MESALSGADGELAVLRAGAADDELCLSPLLQLMALEGEAWSVLRILWDVGCTWHSPLSLAQLKQSVLAAGEQQEATFESGCLLAIISSGIGNCKRGLGPQKLL